MKVTMSKTEITIVLPISPRPSASGKSLVVASTAGNKPTVCEYEGKSIIVGCNCYVSK